MRLRDAATRRSLGADIAAADHSEAEAMCDAIRRRFALRYALSWQTLPGRERAAALARLKAEEAAEIRATMAGLRARQRAARRQALAHKALEQSLARHHGRSRLPAYGRMQGPTPR